MEYSVVPSSGGKDVLMRGRFTFADHSRFASILKQIETGDAVAFCFDFSGVEFIDSAAIGLMLIAREKAKDNGVEITLRGATGKVATIFRMARFDQMFSVVNA